MAKPRKILTLNIREVIFIERIASFCVDHTKLKKGMYISRIDDDIVTYDIRMAIPNGGEYLEYDAIHTIEHLIATYLRNSNIKEKIIYVGPMGCRTGFYILMRNPDHKEAIKEVLNGFRFVAAYDGEIPGNTAIECGNYLEHDLLKAKDYSKDIVNVLTDYSVNNLQYI